MAEHKYPIIANAGLVDRDEVREYLHLLFGNHPFSPTEWVCLRGIGEKGTPREGEFREDIFYQPIKGDITDLITDHVVRWSQHHVASFIVPAVLKEKKGTAENVCLFTNLVIDLDSGNTDERMLFLRDHVGIPTFVVASGGRTESGHIKRHCYYVLTEGTPDVARAIALRDELSRKAGGDLMMGLGVDSNPYGRAHQPVRIAGSVHAKHGNAVRCAFEFASGPHWPIDVLADKIANMPAAEWSHAPAVAAPMSAGELFHPLSGAAGHSISDTLNSDCYEGQEGPNNRFNSLSRIIGFYIGLARRGEMTIDAAKQESHGWMLAHMKPPYPDSRFEGEFDKLLKLDTGRLGPISPTPAPTIIPKPEPKPEGILGWAVSRWIKEPAPQHDWIVDQLLVRGEPALFVAEGGAGKTGLLIDLARKIAAWQEGDEMKWCGQSVLGGGTVVLMLCEDSKTEINRRIMEIDAKEMLRRKAGDRLIVIPMPAAGGAFPFVQKDWKTGKTVPTQEWFDFYRELQSLPDLALVGIDVLNSISHSDENNATAVAELMREAGRVCGGLGAALMVTHHLRKAGNEPIRDLHDLRENIRGSSALTSYFRIVLGAFEATDFKRRMIAIGEKPARKMLFRFGVAKGNINGLMRTEKSLLRGPIGVLEDVTDRDPFNDVNFHERIAWLVLAVRLAAEAGHPYQTGTGANGLYSRRNELPPILRTTGKYEFSSMLEEAMSNNQVAQCAVAGSKSKNWLDIPDGPLASDEAGAEISKGAYTPPVWENFSYSDVDCSCVLKENVKTPFQHTQK